MKTDMKFICLATCLLGTDALTVNVLEGHAKPQFNSSHVDPLKTHKNTLTAVDSQHKADGTPGLQLRRQSDHSSDDFFKKYHSYEAIKSTLHVWAANHPKLATFIPSIGKTHEGRDIFAFKIARRGSRQMKKIIWFNGGFHAREWISPAAVTYMINQLLQDAKTPRVKKLLDGYEFHFTPLANPDGYEFSRLPGHRMWRKNRRNNGDGTFGVDLNRNWDMHWKNDSSSNATKEVIYSGPSPHSEPEVQALANYTMSIPQGYGFIDFHSYGQQILRNWMWTVKPAQNEDVLVELSKAVQQAFADQGQKYGIKSSREFYLANGNMLDWITEKAQFVSLAIELCPPSSTNDTDDLFALDASSIVSCSKGAYTASLAFSEFLLEHPNIPPMSSP
ncbi:hypothetical protein DSO57_1029612 [Entomophthora muscae]|uniref:Uncharacterized protein n=1 Tax=Entomophthora muscae TaxID=34485 RepID=A0ACC2TZS4_9FUNG|nr:hypothetical protein DSO57_1029612 [Entomophthora muscae]